VLSMQRTEPKTAREPSRATSPRRRGLAPVAGLVAGSALGVLFVILTAGALADRAVEQSSVSIDATHVPALLTAPGEPVELRYDVHCVPALEDVVDAPCEVDGSVHVRPGASGPYRELPLRVDRKASEGRYVARVPADVARMRGGFTYYAVFHSPTSGVTTTLPAGGAQAPQRSIPLGATVDVAIGPHRFGETRRPDARMASVSWGGGPGDAGLENGRGLPPVGAPSFDVASDGTLVLLDQVHKRLLRWAPGASSPVAARLEIDGTLADLAVASDGTAHVLELAHAGKPPVLRAFGPAGESRGAAEIPERTASQVRIGPGGPSVLQQPSGQWVLTAVGGRSVDVAAAGGPRAGRALPGGEELVVLRSGNEVRAAITGPLGVRQSWRVTSDTPLGEVQLAEPLGTGLLLVVRVYTDSDDEFAVLVLDSKGIVQRFSVTSAEWAETAPLSRFRLAGASLYHLGSTAAGAFVDRYDLEASR
jgi:hypothetical protein